MSEQLTKANDRYSKDEWPLHPAQVAAFRRMTPAEKLEIALQLRQAAWELKAAGLRTQHPEWSEEQVQESVREIFLYART
jgi:hypothetical protein